jgi:hypothetical protein
VLVLFLYGAATHGLFHMIDYPIFLGYAAYFSIPLLRNSSLLTRRVDFIRYTLALSLMWASVEKWVYPHWTSSILGEHPHLALGISHTNFIALAGAVEFGLAFALLWTPIIRKLAAVVLSIMMVSAVYEFGAVDALGHLLIVVALIAVAAEPGISSRRIAHTMHRTLRAPALQALTLLFVIGGYYAAHFMVYKMRHENASETLASAIEKDVRGIQ